MAIADDEVIKDADIHQGQGVLEALGNAQVGLARFGDPGGMVMSENDGGGAEFEGAAHHFARVDAGAVDGAVEELLVPQHLVAVIEEEAGEDFMGIVVELALDEGPGGLRAGQGVAPVHLGGQVTPAHLQHRLELHILGGAESLVFTESFLIGREKAPQAVKVGKQVTGQVDGTLAGYPGAQEDRQEFRVGQGPGAACQELFTRALVLRQFQNFHAFFPW